MEEPNAFFVYGTLKQKQLRGGMWPRKPASIAPGVVRARLFDMGPYPAALRDSSDVARSQAQQTTVAEQATSAQQATVAEPCTDAIQASERATDGVWLLGEIWQFRHVDLAETKRVLDQIEGYQPGASHNEYVRAVVDAHLILQSDQEPSRSCWMYFSPDQDHLVGKREIIPFCTLSEVFSDIDEYWSHKKVAFWPDPLARVPRSFSEE